MASLQFPLPEPFNFHQPNEWSKWKWHSGLVKEEELHQLSALLYCMGDDVLMISTEDKKKYHPVMGKFEDYFKVRCNVILERARFIQQNQLPTESAEQCITTLYNRSSFASRVVSTSLPTTK